MKTQLRNLARRMTTWPIIGRAVRIAIAVIRSPETREALNQLSQAQPSIESINQLSQAQPSILEALQAVQARDNDRENLVKSVPVALRMLKQELNELQIKLSPQTIQARDNEQDNLIKSAPVVLRMLKQELNELQIKLSQIDELQIKVSQIDDLQIKTSQIDDLQIKISQIDELQIRQNQIEDAYKANDIKSLWDSINYLMGRVEFVRRELIFEMRYGATSPIGNKEHLKAKTEIISTDKFEKARNNVVKLNLGCGHVVIDSYLNVDRRALPGVDIVAEVEELPFKQNEVDEIFSAHLLEHFPQEQLRRELLPYWASLIKPGGIFRAVVPDANSMIHAYAGGTYPYSSLREVTFGAQDYDGDFHFNMFVPEQLSELLEEAGLINFELVVQGRKNGECFEMEIKAVKK
ncbi:methyltransferase domain-containing protein [Pseudomonas sp. LT1P18]|uniref:methyltransferase domain-containing protein n=1 Tax=Pseudomonas arabinosi TaxID=3398357 RepID=UPI0039EFA3FD